MDQEKIIILQNIIRISMGFKRGFVEITSDICEELVNRMVREIGEMHGRDCGEIEGDYKHMHHNQDDIARISESLFTGAGYNIEFQNAVGEAYKKLLTGEDVFSELEFLDEGDSDSLRRNELISHVKVLSETLDNTAFGAGNDANIFRMKKLLRQQAITKKAYQSKPERFFLLKNVKEAVIVSRRDKKRKQAKILSSKGFRELENHRDSLKTLRSFIGSSNRKGGDKKHDNYPSSVPTLPFTMFLTTFSDILAGFRSRFAATTIKNINFLFNESIEFADTNGSKGPESNQAGSAASRNKKIIELKSKRIEKFSSNLYRGLGDQGLTTVVDGQIDGTVTYPEGEGNVHPRVVLDQLSYEDGHGLFTGWFDNGLDSSNGSTSGISTGESSGYKDQTVTINMNVSNSDAMSVPVCFESAYKRRKNSGVNMGSLGENPSDPMTSVIDVLMLSSLYPGLTTALEKLKHDNHGTGSEIKITTNEFHNEIFKIQNNLPYKEWVFTVKDHVRETLSLAAGSGGSSGSQSPNTASTVEVDALAQRFLQKHNPNSYILSSPVIPTDIPLGQYEKSQLSVGATSGASSSDDKESGNKPTGVSTTHAYNVNPICLINKTIGKQGKKEMKMGDCKKVAMGRSEMASISLNLSEIWGSIGGSFGGNEGVEDDDDTDSESDEPSASPPQAANRDTKDVTADKIKKTAPSGFHATINNDDETSSVFSRFVSLQRKHVEDIRLSVGIWMKEMHNEKARQGNYSDDEDNVETQNRSDLINPNYPLLSYFGDSTTAREDTSALDVHFRNKLISNAAIDENIISKKISLKMNKLYVKSTLNELVMNLYLRLHNLYNSVNPRGLSYEVEKKAKYINGRNGVLEWRNRPKIPSEQPHLDQITERLVLDAEIAVKANSSSSSSAAAATGSGGHAAAAAAVANQITTEEMNRKKQLAKSAVFLWKKRILQGSGVIVEEESRWTRGLTYTKEGFVGEFRERNNNLKTRDPSSAEGAIRVKRKAASIVWRFLRDVEEKILKEFTTGELKKVDFNGLLFEAVKNAGNNGRMQTSADDESSDDDDDNSDAKADTVSATGAPQLPSVVSNKIAIAEEILAKGILDYTTERLIFPGPREEDCVSPGSYENPFSGCSSDITEESVKEGKGSFGTRIYNYFKDLEKRVMELKKILTREEALNGLDSGTDKEKLLIERVGGKIQKQDAKTLILEVKERAKVLREVANRYIENGQPKIPILFEGLSEEFSDPRSSSILANAGSYQRITTTAMNTLNLNQNIPQPTLFEIIDHDFSILATTITKFQKLNTFNLVLPAFDRGLESVLLGQEFTDESRLGRLYGILLGIPEFSGPPMEYTEQFSGLETEIIREKGDTAAGGTVTRDSGEDYGIRLVQEAAVEESVNKDIMVKSDTEKLQAASDFRDFYTEQVTKGLSCSLGEKPKKINRTTSVIVWQSMKEGNNRGSVEMLPNQGLAGYLARARACKARRFLHVMINSQSVFVRKLKGLWRVYREEVRGVVERKVAEHLRAVKGREMIKESKSSSVDGSINVNERLTTVQKLALELSIQEKRVSTVASVNDNQNQNLPVQSKISENLLHKATDFLSIADRSDSESPFQVVLQKPGQSQQSQKVILFDTRFSWNGKFLTEKTINLIRDEEEQLMQQYSLFKKNERDIVNSISETDNLSVIVNVDHVTDFLSKSAIINRIDNDENKHPNLDWNDVNHAWYEDSLRNISPSTEGDSEVFEKLVVDQLRENDPTNYSNKAITDRERQNQKNSFSQLTFNPLPYSISILDLPSSRWLSHERTQSNVESTIAQLTRLSEFYMGFEKSSSSQMYRRERKLSEATKLFLDSSLEAVSQGSGVGLAGTGKNNLSKGTATTQKAGRKSGKASTGGLPSKESLKQKRQMFDLEDDSEEFESSTGNSDEENDINDLQGEEREIQNMSEQLVARGWKLYEKIENWRSNQEWILENGEFHGKAQDSGKADKLLSTLAQLQTAIDSGIEALAALFRRGHQFFKLSDMLRKRDKNVPLVFSPSFTTSEQAKHMLFQRAKHQRRLRGEYGGGILGVINWGEKQELEGRGGANLYNADELQKEMLHEIYVMRQFTYGGDQTPDSNRFWGFVHEHGLFGKAWDDARGILTQHYKPGGETGADGMVQNPDSFLYKEPFAYEIEGFFRDIRAFNKGYSLAPTVTPVGGSSSSTALSSVLANSAVGVGEATSYGRRKAVNALQSIRDLEEMIERAGGLDIAPIFNSVVGGFTPSTDEILLENSNSGVSHVQAGHVNDVISNADLENFDDSVFNRRDVLFSEIDGKYLDDNHGSTDRGFYLLTHNARILLPRNDLRTFIDKNISENTQRAKETEDILQTHLANPFSKYDSRISAKGIWIKYRVRDVAEDVSKDREDLWAFIHIKFRHYHGEAKYLDSDYLKSINGKETPAEEGLLNGDSIGSCANRATPLDVSQFFPLAGHEEREREIKSKEYLDKVVAWKKKFPSAKSFPTVKPMEQYMAQASRGGGEYREADGTLREQPEATDAPAEPYPSKPWDPLSERELEALELGLSFISEILHVGPSHGSTGRINVGGNGENTSGSSGFGMERNELKLAFIKEAPKLQSWKMKYLGEQVKMEEEVMDENEETGQVPGNSKDPKQMGRTSGYSVYEDAQVKKYISGPFNHAESVSTKHMPTCKGLDRISERKGFVENRRNCPSTNHLLRGRRILVSMLKKMEQLELRVEENIGAKIASAIIETGLLGIEKGTESTQPAGGSTATGSSQDRAVVAAPAVTISELQNQGIINSYPWSQIRLDRSYLEKIARVCTYPTYGKNAFQGINDKSSNTLGHILKVLNTESNKGPNTAAVADGGANGSGINAVTNINSLVDWEFSENIYLKNYHVLPAEVLSKVAGAFLSLLRENQLINSGKDKEFQQLYTEICSNEQAGRSLFLNYPVELLNDYEKRVQTQGFAPSTNSFLDSLSGSQNGASSSADQPNLTKTRFLATIRSIQTVQTSLCNKINTAHTTSLVKNTLLRRFRISRLKKSRSLRKLKRQILGQFFSSTSFTQYDYEPNENLDMNFEQVLGKMFEKLVGEMLKAVYNTVVGSIPIIGDWLKIKNKEGSGGKTKEELEREAREKAEKEAWTSLDKSRKDVEKRVKIAMQVYDRLVNLEEEMRSENFVQCRAPYSFEKINSGSGQVIVSEGDKEFYGIKEEGISSLYGTSYKNLIEKNFKEVDGLECKENLNAATVTGGTGTNGGVGRVLKYSDLQSSYAETDLKVVSQYSNWFLELKNGEGSGMVDSLSFEEMLIRKNEGMLYTGSEPMWKSILFRRLIEQADLSLQGVYSELLKEEFTKKIDMLMEAEFTSYENTATNDDNNEKAVALRKSLLKNKTLKIALRNPELFSTPDGKVLLKRMLEDSNGENSEHTVKIEAGKLMIKAKNPEQIEGQPPEDEVNSAIDHQVRQEMYEKGLTPRYGNFANSEWYKRAYEKKKNEIENRSSKYKKRISDLQKITDNKNSFESDLISKQKLTLSGRDGAIVRAQRTLASRAAAIFHLMEWNGYPGVDTDIKYSQRGHYKTWGNSGRSLRIDAGAEGRSLTDEEDKAYEKARLENDANDEENGGSFSEGSGQSYKLGILEQRRQAEIDERRKQERYLGYQEDRLPIDVTVVKLLEWGMEDRVKNEYSYQNIILRKDFERTTVSKKDGKVSKRYIREGFWTRLYLRLAALDRVNFPKHPSHGEKKNNRYDDVIVTSNLGSEDDDWLSLDEKESLLQIWCLAYLNQAAKLQEEISIGDFKRVIQNKFTFNELYTLLNGEDSGKKLVESKKVFRTDEEMVNFYKVMNAKNVEWVMQERMDRETFHRRFHERLREYFNDNISTMVINEEGWELIRLAMLEHKVIETNRTPLSYYFEKDEETNSWILIRNIKVNENYTIPRNSPLQMTSNFMERKMREMKREALTLEYLVENIKVKVLKFEPPVGGSAVGASSDNGWGWSEGPRWSNRSYRTETSPENNESDENNNEYKKEREKWANLARDVNKNARVVFANKRRAKEKKIKAMEKYNYPVKNNDEASEINTADIPMYDGFSSLQRPDYSAVGRGAGKGSARFSLVRSYQTGLDQLFNEESCSNSGQIRPEIYQEIQDGNYKDIIVQVELSAIRVMIMGNQFFHDTVIRELKLGIEGRNKGIKYNQEVIDNLMKPILAVFPEDDITRIPISEKINGLSSKLVLVIWQLFVGRFAKERSAGGVDQVQTDLYWKMIENTAVAVEIENTEVLFDESKIIPQRILGDEELINRIRRAMIHIFAGPAWENEDRQRQENGGGEFRLIRITVSALEKQDEIDLDLNIAGECENDSNLLGGFCGLSSRLSSGEIGSSGSEFIDSETNESPPFHLPSPRKLLFDLWKLKRAAKLLSHYEFQKMMNVDCNECINPISKPEKVEYLEWSVDSTRDVFPISITALEFSESFRWILRHFNDLIPMFQPVYLNMQLNPYRMPRLSSIKKESGQENDDIDDDSAPLSSATAMSKSDLLAVSSSLITFLKAFILSMAWLFRAFLQYAYIRPQFQDARAEFLRLQSETTRFSGRLERQMESLFVAVEEGDGNDDNISTATNGGLDSPFNQVRYARAVTRLSYKALETLSIILESKQKNGYYVPSEFLRRTPYLQGISTVESKTTQSAMMLFENSGQGLALDCAKDTLSSTETAGECIKKKTEILEDIVRLQVYNLKSELNSELEYTLGNGGIRSFTSNHGSHSASLISASQSEQQKLSFMQLHMSMSEDEIEKGSILARQFASAEEPDIVRPETSQTVAVTVFNREIDRIVRNHFVQGIRVPVENCQEDTAMGDDGRAGKIAKDIKCRGTVVSKSIETFSFDGTYGKSGTQSLIDFAASERGNPVKRIRTCETLGQTPGTSFTGYALYETIKDYFSMYEQIYNRVVNSNGRENHKITFRQAEIADLFTSSMIKNFITHKVLWRPCEESVMLSRFLLDLYWKMVLLERCDELRYDSEGEIDFSDYDVGGTGNGDENMDVPETTGPEDASEETIDREVDESLGRDVNTATAPAAPDSNPPAPVSQQQPPPPAAPVAKARLKTTRIKQRPDLCKTRAMQKVFLKEKKQRDTVGRLKLQRNSRKKLTRLKLKQFIRESGNGIGVVLGKEGEIGGDITDNGFKKKLQQLPLEKENGKENLFFNQGTKNENNGTSNVLEQELLTQQLLWVHIQDVIGEYEKYFKDFDGQEEWLAAKKREKEYWKEIREWELKNRNGYGSPDLDSDTDKDEAEANVLLLDPPPSATPTPVDPVKVVENLLLADLQFLSFNKAVADTVNGIQASSSGILSLLPDNIVAARQAEQTKRQQLIANISPQSESQEDIDAAEQKKQIISNDFNSAAIGIKQEVDKALLLYKQELNPEKYPPPANSDTETQIYYSEEYGTVLKNLIVNSPEYLFDLPGIALTIDELGRHDTILKIVKLVEREIFRDADIVKFDKLYIAEEKEDREFEKAIADIEKKQTENTDAADTPETTNKIDLYKLSLGSYLDYKSFEAVKDQEFITTIPNLREEVKTKKQKHITDISILMAELFGTNAVSQQDIAVSAAASGSNGANQDQYKKSIEELQKHRLKYEKQVDDWEIEQEKGIVAREELIKKVWTTYVEETKTYVAGHTIEIFLELPNGKLSESRLTNEETQLLRKILNGEANGNQVTSSLADASEEDILSSLTPIQRARRSVLLNDKRFYGLRQKIADEDAYKKISEALLLAQEKSAATDGGTKFPGLISQQSLSKALDIAKIRRGFRHAQGRLRVLQARELEKAWAKGNTSKKSLAKTEKEKLTKESIATKFYIEMLIMVVKKYLPANDPLVTGVASQTGTANASTNGPVLSQNTINFLQKFVGISVLLNNLDLPPVYDVKTALVQLNQEKQLKQRKERVVRQ